LTEQYKEIKSKIQEMTVNVMQSFVKAITARDKETGNHSKNVAKLMLVFSNHLNLSPQETKLAYLSGMVHDIGKIGIPDGILNKSAKLAQHEFAVIRCHPDIGADILAGIGEFEEIAHAVRYHHEWYDGNGYAHGLQGLEIPRLSRMLTLCDSYDAMTTARCYRKSVTLDKAIEEIEQNRGTQFDPELSKSFITVIRQSPITWLRN